MGPRTVACVRSTVSTIFFVEVSMISWSYALRRIRMFWAMADDLLEDVDDAAGADGATTLADGEAQALVHGDGLAQLDGHVDVVTRHHHLGALRQLDRAGDVGGPEVELGPVVVEERLVAAALLL